MLGFFLFVCWVSVVSGFGGFFVYVFFLVNRAHFFQPNTQTSHVFWSAHIESHTRVDSVLTLCHVFMQLRPIICWWRIKFPRNLILRKDNVWNLLVLVTYTYQNLCIKPPMYQNTYVSKLQLLTNHVQVWHIAMQNMKLFVTIHQTFNSTRIIRS